MYCILCREYPSVPFGCAEPNVEPRRPIWLSNATKTCICDLMRAGITSVKNKAYKRQAIVWGIFTW